MKKRFRKIISMLLAAAMVLSMGLTGLAAEIDPLASSQTTKGSITIENAASGETYTIYQIFELTYADYTVPETSSNSYSYNVVDAWKSFISSYTYVNSAGETVNLFELEENGDLKITSNVFNELDNSDVMAVFAQAALEYATQNGITATATQIASSNSDTVEFTGLNLGYYLVDTTLGSLCFLSSTDPDATIEEKNPTPSLEKEEYDLETDTEYTDKDSAEVGDTIDYEVFIHDIAHSVNLVMHETMSKGLTFSEGTVEVYVGYPDPSITDLLNDNTTTWTKLTAGTEYIEDDSTTETPLQDGCTFELSFDDEWLNSLSSGAVIKVYYKAVVNENAIDEENLWDIENNTVYLTFGDSSTSKEATTYTDTVGFNILKYSGTITNVLEGAEFSLYRDSTHTDIVYFIPIYSNGSLAGYEEVDPLTYTGSGQPTTTIVAGSIYVKGLHVGTYYLTETKAPDGYNLLTSDVIIEIVLNDEDGTNITETVKVDGVEASDQTAEIENNSGSILPGTGGMGTTIFYIVGIVLMIGAAAFFVARKRISKEE